ncbi:hypothetical protein AT15_02270 [Kosmotoga arenicorallina S304]|uniref:Uncharacterized protein n=1 Tax=Kosmotoga arenicorallina S304 TaxID=1453497 RepID=A0A176JZA6_9BACT|nr:hypothetical protein [Kosmotoga arenicorallina]OAA29366.1 hypothetical protein AT15_02270 [Kosmotoga arenicorallina S304]
MYFLKSLTGLLSLGACLLERPGEGNKKKQELKNLIYQVLPEEDWKLDKNLLDEVLDKAIDIVVSWLNRTIWKTA